VGLLHLHCDCLYAHSKDPILVKPQKNAAVDLQASTLERPTATDTGGDEEREAGRYGVAKLSMDGRRETSIAHLTCLLHLAEIRPPDGA
jgi:hypothetical protein